MQNLKRVKFYCNKEFKKDIIKDVIDKGYGVRGSSQWMREAISDFLQDENFFLYVVEDKFKNFDEQINFSIDQKLLDVVENARLKVRSHDPLCEAINSKIYRIAALYRIIRKK